jgi:hypothetical protein
MERLFPCPIVYEDGNAQQQVADSVSGKEGVHLGGTAGGDCPYYNS